MSRDIRSFFKVDSSKKRKNEDDLSPIDKKKNLLINKLISSDTEESKEKRIKKKRRIIESDEEEGEAAVVKEKTEVIKKESKHQKEREKPPKAKKEVDVKDIGSLFGGPVKRKERSKTAHALPKRPCSAAAVVVAMDRSDEERILVGSDEAKQEEAEKDSPGKENRIAEETPEQQVSSAEIAIKVEAKAKVPDKKAQSSTVHDKKNQASSPVRPKSSPVKPPATSASSSKQASQRPAVTMKPPSSSLSHASKQPPASKSQPKPSTMTVSLDDFSFVDKYKPTSVKQIIGQQAPQSNANKLQHWLLNWYKHHGDPNKKPAKANPYAKNNDGSSFKAALLSGPPGIGKTTTANLVSKECLFDIVEFNASDTRSKKLLKEEVSQLLANTSLRGYLTGDEKAVSRRHVLIMDEVDGMAGNEDRGGIAELIQLIKESRIPVICMCNDRAHPKMRSLVNYCFDLKFNKPSTNQIRSAMMSICFKEGLKMEPGAVDAIISGTGNDVRQTLNHLALYSANKDDQKISTDSAKKNAQMSEKDVKIGPWDVIRKVFSTDEHQTMSFNDKSDLFFYDYNIAPLFVQENYLNVKPACRDSEVLGRIARTANSLSLGDMVESKIRSNMAWSLLPTQAVFSSVLPGEYMKGSFKGPPVFPTWLGKNSNAQKRKRLAQELHDHTRVVTSGSRMAIRLDYSQFLVKAIVRPLKEKGLEGVSEALDIIKSYHLLREDIDSLLEITKWGSAKSLWDQVDSKVKAALTRAYNKEVQPYSYSVQAGVKKKTATSSYDTEGFEDDDEKMEESEHEEDDSIEKSGMIKVKKSVSSSKDSKTKASTSKSTKTTVVKRGSGKK